MKPNFALSLSADGIRLLQRAVSGWRLVGEVSPHSTELKSELAGLRDKAAALAPEGIRCKIVIPNEQIRYLSIETSEMHIADVRNAARDALDGATPYAIEELVFDVTLEGGLSHIAAVARETLDEAGNFAQEHSFNPICFVAIPNEHAFLGEPYFGPASGASEFLDEIQTIEQDGAAIVVIGDAVGPDVEQTVNVPEGREAGSLTPQRDYENQPLDVSDRAPQNDIAANRHVSTNNVSDLTPTFSSRRRARAAIDRVFPPARVAPVLETGFAEAHPDPLIPQNQTTLARVSSEPQAKNAFTRSSESQRLTTFGERSDQPKKHKSWPLAAALLVALIAVLAGFGTFASGKLPTNIGDLFDWKTRATAEATAIQVSPPAGHPNQVAPGSELPEGIEKVTLSPDLTDEDAAVLNALRTPLQDDQDGLSTLAPPDEFLAKYAVTGIWPLAPDVPHPPAQLAIEDLYVTRVDPIVPSFDAVALPQLEGINQDLIIAAPNSTAAKTSLTLGSPDLIAEGDQSKISPDGAKRLTGSRLVQLTNLPGSASAPTDLTAPASSKLAAFRPRLRPDIFVNAVESPTLDEVTRSKLAQIRAPKRPVSSGAARGASLAQQDTNVAPLIDQNVDNSSRSAIVVTTRRPDVRPSNFDQIVARSQQTATAASTANPVRIAPRSVVNPSIPSSASVAREATVTNAINLRKVNLIGVYGTPSQRRALIRLGNGRYQKVEVGDLIDGGNISAIGEAELRYQKSGRNIILRMPKS